MQAVPPHPTASSVPHDNHTNGLTPLHYVARKNDHDKAQQLIDAGADVNALDIWERTPLHIAAEFNSPAVAELLLKNEADVYAKTMQGDTALHWAATCNAVRIAQMLIDSGAYISAAGRFDLTPLHWALELNRAPDVARLLIENDADLNATNISTWIHGGWTPLHVAAKWNAFGSIPLMLQSGADINARDRVGNTPLHDAAARGSVESVMILLEAGRIHHDGAFGPSADIHAKNKKGDPPLVRARKADVYTVEDKLRQGIVMKILRAHGAYEQLCLFA